MVQFGQLTVFADDEGALPYMAGVSDLDLALFDGQWHLYATDRITGTITAFHVMGGGGPISGNDIQYISGGTSPAGGLELIETAGGTFAVLTGLSYSPFAAYDVSADGTIGSGLNFDPGPDQSRAVIAAEVVPGQGGNLLVTAQWEQSGVTVRQLDGTGLPGTYLQSVTIDGAEVTAIGSLDTGAGSVVVVADAARNQLLSYTVGADARLTAADVLDAEDGPGMARPELLEMVSLAGLNYGLVASSGSSSITVFAIAPDGSMQATDHVYDGLSTRFANISEMTLVDANGRVFVLVAGSDDGISLLELLPGGRLLHLASIPDGVDMPLTNVSGLAGQVQGGVLYVYAASGTEPGLAELRIDLGSPATLAPGGTGDDTLTGSADDELLYGGPGGEDDLRGGGGDDILVAGGDGDRLEGGNGADIFVLGGAGAGTRVTDFDTGQDRLDLSGWQFLYGTGQLTVSANGAQVTLSFREYSVTVFSDTGADLDPDALLGRVTIDLSHALNPVTPPDPGTTYTYFGTAGDDQLIGDVGRDVFVASGGADSIIGGDNADMVSFEQFTEGVKVDLLFPERNTGEVADDMLESIEDLFGSDLNDLLIGDLGQNWFWGGAGNDDLRGRAARDRMFGGEGDDAFNGGKGRDRLEGDAGDDYIEGLGGRDFLKGGRDNDTLLGGDNEDRLLGGKGRDILHGGAGRDVLEGSQGNDTLTGGQGADIFVFAEGHARDVVTDFNALNDAEKLDLQALSAITGYTDLMQNYARQVGSDVEIDTGGGDVIVLQGVDLTDLDVDDFLF